MEGASRDPLLGRRTLLKCSLGAACAPALVQLAGCGRIDVPVTVEVGPPSHDLVSLPVSRVPELTQAGGSVLLHPQGTDSFGRPLSILVANTSQHGLRAWGAYCPHAGCEVAWVDGADQVVCPCHKSRFAADGTVVQPPARADLDTFGAKISTDGQTLIVDLGGIGGAFPPAKDGAVTFTVSQLPALAQLGGSVTGRSLGVPFPLLVLRQSAATLLAYDARCTHLGCAVRGAQKLLVCPCHGSLFNLDGSVKLGPAKLPLKTLHATFDGTTAVVRVA